MPFKHLGTSLVGVLSLSLLVANTSQADSRVESFCDFDAVDGYEVDIMPMAMGNKKLSRERLNDPTVYPHFFYDYSTDRPVREKSIQHRSAAINGDEFYRVNEGSKNHPKHVRYYRTTLEDCSRIYLRISEQSEEYRDYWEDRGDKELSFAEFLKEQGEKLSVGFHDAAVLLDDYRAYAMWLTMTPMRAGDSWWLRKDSGELVSLSPSNKVKFKILKVKSKPFVANGEMVSPLSMKIRFDDGTSYWAPGHSHGLIPWESHQGLSVALGGSEATVFANYGEPDRVTYLPVFRSSGGAVIVEDEVLRERLSQGSGINAVKLQRSEKIGSVKVLEFFREEERVEVKLNLDSEIDTFLTK